MREFTNMGDKRDEEKGRYVPFAAHNSALTSPHRSIEELSSPQGLKCNHSTDKIRQRVASKERNHEANQHAGGTIQRMQFTFSVDQLIQPRTSTPVKKPDAKPSAEPSK